MNRILCVVLGYCFGCLLTAELVTWKTAGKRAGEVGSGNPGTANIAANLGVRHGAIVLAGDILKTVIPCMLCRFVFFPDLVELSVLYAGAGVLAGHNFPFWNRFKGGMGVAVTCTYIVLAAPIWGLIANITGLLAVLLTGYLAVGAVLIPLIYIIPLYLLYGAEVGAVATAGTILLISRHTRPLGRIYNRTEKRIDFIAKLKRGK